MSNNRRPAFRRMIRMARFLLLLIPGLLPAAAACGDVVINEVMASNGYFENGHAWDWVELYNSGVKAVDLSGWYFSDSAKNPLKWSFPKGTKLKKGGYLTVWCTGEKDIRPGSGSAFYTDFAISSSGEKLILSDAEGNEVTRLELPPQYGCVSYGLPSGGGEYGYLETPTRGAKNGREAYAGRTGMPALHAEGDRMDRQPGPVEGIENEAAGQKEASSGAGGFFTGSVRVTASGPEGALLRYSTDGSTPSAKSSAFPAEGLELKKTKALRVRAFREGEVRTVGTDIDKLMPPLSRFGSSGRDKKKKGIIEKLKAFFEKFFGIGADFDDDPDDTVPYDVPESIEETLKAAEPQKGFNVD